MAGRVNNRKRPQKTRTSTIYFVGSGPGDPELITVKGMKLLKKADIVVYTGSLVDETALKHCKKGVKVHNSASMHLEEIMAVLVRAAKAGKKIVRLHTGDPSLYSAFREQADILDIEGIPYEVIPGVSSAFAAAAALKRELTMPEVTQTVIFTRHEGKTPVPGSEKLSKLAAHKATICIFLSVGMMEKVARELMETYPPSTPAAVVYKATWDDELVVTGTLKDIAGRVKAAGIKRQAIIIVGSALGNKEKHASRLYDRYFKHWYRRI